MARQARKKTAPKRTGGIIMTDPIPAADIVQGLLHNIRDRQQQRSRLYQDIITAADIAERKALGILITATPGGTLMVQASEEVPPGEAYARQDKDKS
jgi:hypothetical protein